MTARLAAGRWRGFLKRGWRTHRQHRRPASTRRHATAGVAPNRVRSVAMKQLKTANRYQERAPIKHGLVGNGSCLAYVGF